MDKKEKSYDVFLSYNSEDYEAVEQIAVYLKEQAGLLPWFDRWNLIPGKSILEYIEIGLMNSSACAVFVGKSGQGPWQNKEVETALRQQIQNADLAVIPVLLPDAPQKPELPLFLQGNLWIDFRGKGLDHDDALWRLECGIRGESPGSGRVRSLERTEARTVERTEFPMNTMEFVNRVDELQYLTGRYCPPYLLLSAPMGFGKTRLLRAVQEQLERQKWLCLFVELSREAPATMNDIALNILQQLKRQGIQGANLSTPESAGHHIGTAILQTLHQTRQENILLIFDEVEALEEYVLHQLLDQFLLVLKDTLRIVNHSIRLRLILSGRYICHWKQFNVKIPLELMHLTPFSFPPVFQIVESCAAKSQLNISQTYAREFASHLMSFTGGHPGCMAAILQREFEIPIVLMLQREESYYTEIIRSVIDEIQDNINALLLSTDHNTPEMSAGHLGKIFLVLSVVRQFNARLLKYFIEYGLIQWSRSEYELEKLLLKTYLISKKSGFLQDGITRRLLAIQLRRKDLPLFLKICETARQFYQTRLKDPATHRPEMLALELLLQQLYVLAYADKSAKEEFFHALPEVLHTLVFKRDARAVMECFYELLQADWEFRFTFNYLLREDVYDDASPFNQLLEHITNFMETL